MEKIEKTWMLGGVVAIIAVSSLLFVAGVMSPFVPMPIYLVIMAWVILYGFIVVLPAVYVMQFKLLHKKATFGKYTLIAAISLAVLNAYYFWNSWAYGVKWQGEIHTKLVAAENILGFALVFILAFLGIRENSKTLQYSSNLLLFLLLSWCAFPYLGESP